MNTFRFVFLVACLIFISFALPGQPKHALTFDDLISFGRLSDPQVSPDGKTVAFVVTYHSKSENKTKSNIYCVAASGGNVLQLTAATGQNVNPRWMPDGKLIAFISTRGGSSQIWTISPHGGEAQKVSSIATEASGLEVSPDGKLYAFTSSVYPDCPDEESNRTRMEETDASKVKAKVFTTLPYRVWNYWKDGKRNHLFVLPTSGGKPFDVTPGDFDTPPIDLGGNWDYAFSPESNELAFTRNTDTLIAISTNNDIFTVSVNGGNPKRITDNPANDSQPLYSPDGRYVAYRRMQRPGFEADQRVLVLYDRKSFRHNAITANQDVSVNEVVWMPDSKSIFFTADDRGRISIFRVSVGDTRGIPIFQQGSVHDLRVTPDGKTLVFLHETIERPAELYRMDIDGKNMRPLTHINGSLLDGLAMNPAEEFLFDGAGGTRVHGLMVKPVGFDEKKSYPMVFLVHGGPQGQWADQFHFRWNAQMFASRGHVVVMINPRGSTGYGQKFTDEISQDWGGKVYEDLMKGLDYVVKTYPFIDGKRVAAAGASYGGYMMNWFLGHTERFTCIVSHDGVFNPWSMYGTSEELWFPEWEFGGMPYTKPELYRKWSPLEYASKFRTPTLVVHGQLDYRVDVSEGFQLFTALQRQGVRSKMLYFPDEGHFVAKPQNAELWYRTVLDWICEFTQTNQN